MDNPLTPNRIRYLIRLAEDKSFNTNKLLPLNEEDVACNTISGTSLNKSATNYESSSGILDLENIEAFGESLAASLSLSKLSTFKPGEITGRSTGTDDIPKPSQATMSKVSPQKLEPEKLGRKTQVISKLFEAMEQQSKDVNELIERQSVSTAYSFNSKRDLTADEMSFVIKEAPLPVIQNVIPQITDTSLAGNASGVSTYFKSKCPDVGKIFGRKESIDMGSMINSITEVSSSTHFNEEFYALKELDSVPVKEMPSGVIPEKLSEKPEIKKTNPNPIRPEHQEVIDRYSMMESAVDFLKNVDAIKPATNNETEASSISISKIASFIRKDCNMSVSKLIDLTKKNPLAELHMNMQNSRVVDDEVTYLKDAKKAETASSTGTVNTVISAQGSQKTNRENTQIPKIITSFVDNPVNVVENDVLAQKGRKSKSPTKNIESETVKSNERVRSKSPSTKSPSTLSTVQEKYSGLNYSDSLSQSVCKGETSTPALSPNVQYKELDKSVDWKDVLQQKRLMQQSLAKDKWAEIIAAPVTGFVGIRCPITVSIKTLIESWLIAKLNFEQDQESDFTIELPRTPLVLSPVKQEEIVIYVTANVEISKTLTFTLHLKDAALDVDMKQNGNILVNFQLPVVQAMSSDGMNKIVFKAFQETLLTKSVVLISDCPVDLQLDLSLSDKSNMFSIKNVQEIKKSDVNKILLNRQGSTEDCGLAKSKSKITNKLICRLASGNAIKVAITYRAPTINQHKDIVTFNSKLNVKMIGVDVVLRTVELCGKVGWVKLNIRSVADKLRVLNESTSINVHNSGTMFGSWVVRYKGNSVLENSIPFKVSTSEFELGPSGSTWLKVTYTGSEDCLCEGVLIFEETSSGAETSLEICGGSDKPISFPIKTNHSNISWVRPGRKELSLKNSADKKYNVLCQFVGKGFFIDLPGANSKSMYRLTFEPYERKILPIIFAPNINTPQASSLHLVLDKNSDVSRKINLYGCASGDLVRWDGHVTYGATALVRAVIRSSVQLKLYNKSNAPVFVAADVHFNLKYRCLADTCTMQGARCIVNARTSHTITLDVDWSRVERLARQPPLTTALATLSVLTGAEMTRRRILRVLHEKPEGELDLSVLPEHLKVLADKYEGVDVKLDDLLADFNETKTSLNELIGGLQELAAQIDLPPDFGDDTIVITDDTVLDHHTIVS